MVVLAADSGSHILSKGISGLMRLKQTKGQAATFASPQINSVRPTELPVPRTGELMTPVPSVTESTTPASGSGSSDTALRFALIISDTSKPA